MRADLIFSLNIFSFGQSILSSKLITRQEYYPCISVTHHAIHIRVVKQKQNAVNYTNVIRNGDLFTKCLNILRFRELIIFCGQWVTQPILSEGEIQ